MDADADGDETADDYEQQSDKQERGPGEDMKIWERERVEDVKVKGKSVGCEVAVGFIALVSALAREQERESDRYVFLAVLSRGAGGLRLVFFGFPVMPWPPRTILLSIPPPITEDQACVSEYANGCLRINRPHARARVRAELARIRHIQDVDFTNPWASTSPALTKAPSMPALTTTPLPPLPASHPSGLVVCSSCIFVDFGWRKAFSPFLEGYGHRISRLQTTHQDRVATRVRATSKTSALSL
ncbi:hypothetical protein B0H13DRAFT_2520749 [Mycena leptocephala]|nr:hypothetical protein B0H13DRAFT_2520749 [Mycena leptocephala]